MGRNRRKRNEPDPIEEQKQAVLDEMKRVGVTHETYPALIKHLSALTEVEKIKSRDFVKRDTLVVVAGGFVQILLIVIFEQKHVWTSKGLSYVSRPKIPG